jgi:hypothetical protein
MSLKIKKLPKGIRFINYGLEDGSFDVMLDEEELKVTSLLALLRLQEMKDYKRLTFWVSDRQIFTIVKDY